jgi:hypothetical protein
MEGGMSMKRCVGGGRRSLMSALAAFVAFAAGPPTPACAQCQPACGKQNIECLNPSPQYNNRTFVCQLRTPGGSAYCTGWIVAPPDCILTCAHCQPAVGDLCVFNFECTACVGGVPKPTVAFAITQIIQCDANQDWCLVRVGGNPSALFGHASIDPSPLVQNQPIYEIHHASGMVKGYDDGIVDVLNDPASAGCPGNIAEHHVTVIASEGASGSPVFRMDNQCVTAMCNCGPPCAPGFALPLSTIWPNVQAAITQAGCTALLCAQGPVCPVSDHNCFTTGGPGCNNPQCCAEVCAIDPFCCQTAWDGACVNEASDLCDGCGDPQAGDCFTVHDTPFCNDRDCCDAVCAADPFCCNTLWDDICVGEAVDLCPSQGGCPVSDHNCFTRGIPGCTDVKCCEQVCAVDPFCCDTLWDNICISEASELCDGCGDPEAGRCDRTHATPFCSDRDCCVSICAVDPFCCNDSWDCICVGEAINMCGLCEADFDSDADVDIDDLFGLLGAWGTPDQLYDIAPTCGNGTIDIDDLFVVIGNWGPC